MVGVISCLVYFNVYVLRNDFEKGKCKVWFMWNKVFYIICFC